MEYELPLYNGISPYFVPVGGNGESKTGHMFVLRPHFSYLLF